MRFGDLKTGDVMTLVSIKSVVVAIEKPHPQFPGLWLIVWYLFGEDKLSFDALNPEYALISGSTVHQDGFVSWHRAMRLINR